MYRTYLSGVFNYRVLLLALLCLNYSVSSLAIEQDSISYLPSWQEGYLDIHHINTTKGNATFILAPDGTSILIDAGDMDVAEFNKKYFPMTANSKYLSDTSFRAGSFIVHYIKCVSDNIDSLDYAVITHYHQDHYGRVRANTPASVTGRFKLTGITEVAELLPIKTIIDRGYDYPSDLRDYYTDATFQNYMSFIDYRIERNKGSVQKLIAGSNTQLLLKNDLRSYPSFSIRNVKTAATVWSGKDTLTNELFTVTELLDKKNKFQENPLSLALKVSYGDFDYYTGGDNTGVANEKQHKPNVESLMAKVIGKVDVMALDHHGNRDANNSFFLEQLQPTVAVGQTWCSDHIGQELAFKLLQKTNDNNAVDVFLTHMHEEAKAYLGPWISNGFKNTEGHTLIRVFPNGQYYVLVLEIDGNRARIVKRFGPYQAN